MIEAYPLYWPEGQMRVPPSRRRSAKFSTGFARARDHLVEELRRMGARAVIVSTNIPLRRDGLPYADFRAPDDPAVAVYFTHGKRQLVIACDSYSKVEWNMRACGATVEALRTIQRHGATELLERAFTGFTALPPKGGEARPWHEVLGVPATASDETIKAAYRSLAARHHPDVGGDAETMARINQAYDLATQRGAQ
jgi:hypothetical protein